VKRAEDDYRAAGLKVIWMGFQDKKEKIAQFMSRHDIDSSVGYDKRDLISKKYGISYGAGLAMIDAEGIVRRRVPKGFSEKTFIEALRKILPAEGQGAERS